MDSSVVGNDELESPPPPHPVSFKNIIQSRLRPISLIKANVRRSSLGLPPKSLLGGIKRPAAVAPGQLNPCPSNHQEASASTSLEAPPEDNHFVEVKIAGDGEYDSSIASSAGTVSQGFSVILDPSSLQQASMKSKKGGLLRRIISRSGSKKSASSSVSVSSAATGSSAAETVNEELEISVIQTIEEERSENEHNSNENASAKKIKKKPKFPKVMLCFRRLRKAVVMRGRKGGGNVTIEEVPEEENEIFNATTPENAEKEPMMSEENVNAADEEEQGDFHPLSETNTDRAGTGDFVITVEAVDEEGEEVVIVEVTTPKHNGGLMELAINYQYWMGLSPIRFDENCNIVSTPLSKTVFVTVCVNAILHSIGQVLAEWKVANDEKHVADKAYYDILVGFNVAITVLLGCYFQCMMFGQKRIKRMVKAERKSPLTNVRIAKYFAIGGRIWSTLVSLGCTFGAFDIVREYTRWTFRFLLRICESDLFYGFLKYFAPNPGATDTANSSTIIGAENYTINGTFSNATHHPNTISPMEVVELGWFIENGYLETNILGGIGLFMNFCYQNILSCAPEIMLASVGSLYIGTWNLGLEKIIRPNQAVSSKKNGTTGSDVDTDDEEYTEEEKKQILKADEQFESLRRLSNKQNDALKSFWPSLVLVILIMVVFLIFGTSIQRWFSIIGMALRTFPMSIGFYLGILITMTSDEYISWFVTPRAQAVLKSGLQRFQMKLAQIILQPFGCGSGSFHINSAFIGTLFGSAMTYYFLVSQSYHANLKAVQE